MKTDGPFILNADDRPILATSAQYKAWIDSLHASDEWRQGGRAFETIFLRSDWLPSGIGAINTMFTPHAPVDARGPQVFQTHVSFGRAADGKFIDLPNICNIDLDRYHTRAEAMAGHNRFLGLIASEGIDAVIRVSLDRLRDPVRS